MAGSKPKPSHRKPRKSPKRKFQQPRGKTKWERIATPLDYKLKETNADDHNR